jgi:hypothetical protein
VRIAHYISDIEAVNVYIDGELVTDEPLIFRRATAYLSVETGERSVTIVTAGDSFDDPVYEQRVTLTGGHDHTVALIGLAGDASVESVILDDTAIVGSVRDPEFPASYAILLHAISGGPSIDFYFDGEMLIEELAYRQYGVVVVEAGAHDVRVTFAGDTDAVLFENSGETAPSNDLLLLTVMTGVYPDNLAVSGAVSRLEGYTALDYLRAYQGEVGFKTFVALLERAELLDLIDREGVFTVFAPTDAAFAALPDAMLPSDPNALADLLRYHIVEANFNTRYMTSPAELITMSGDALVIRGNEETAFVNGDTRILFGGFPTVVNGNVIAIDAVLMPPD